MHEKMDVKDGGCMSLGLKDPFMRPSAQAGE